MTDRAKPTPVNPGRARQRDGRELGTEIGRRKSFPECARWACPYAQGRFVLCYFRQPHSGLDSAPARSQNDDTFKVLRTGGRRIFLVRSRTPTRIRTALQMLRNPDKQTIAAQSSSGEDQVNYMSIVEYQSRFWKNASRNLIINQCCTQRACSARFTACSRI